MAAELFTDQPCTGQHDAGCLICAFRRLDAHWDSLRTPPAPRIPYALWPLAIVGALLFAHVVNAMWDRARR